MQIHICDWDTVIAREAKQSILPLRGGVDCFAALAMTALLFENRIEQQTLTSSRP
jgi:hypothetical protein